MLRTPTNSLISIAAALLLAAGCASPTSGPGSGDPVTGDCITDYSCPMGEECSGGGCAAVAPTIYPHIQTAQALFREYLDDAEVSWRAAHYDLVIGRLVYYIDDVRAVNPNIRGVEYVNVRHHLFTESKVADWCAPRGYDPEDFYLHYREDTMVPGWENTVLVEGFPAGMVPGWNPNWQAGDPPASATSRSQARLVNNNDYLHSPWYLAAMENEGYREYLRDHMIGVLTGANAGLTYATGPIDAFIADDAFYYAHFNEGQLDRTNEYYGIPVDENHPHAVAFETLYPELAEGLHDHFGQTIDVTPNFGNVLFLRDHTRTTTNIRNAVPWVWAEVWMMFRGYSGPTTGSQRVITYEIDYKNGIKTVVERTRQGQRVILGARDMLGGGAGSDRGRLYTLALYYLVHNPNTFYLYESVFGHSNGGHLSTWAWNPAVEFDLGQPDQNPPGQADFEGNAGTTEHYLWATGADAYDPQLTYRIFARRFTNALVLAKMLPKGSVVDDRSITTHALDGTYFVLQSDGTLGATVTEISLRNNEGAILIPAD